jgi:vacuolar iron transporter family protein
MAVQSERHSKPKTRLGKAVDSVNRGAGVAPAQHEPHANQENWLRDVILGGQDGLVNILGIELGIVAAGASSAVLITTGLAAAITESISMGAVSYTSSMTERDYYRAQEERENREIDTVPSEEEAEVRQIYKSKGFQGELLDKVVETITSNRTTWVDTMMDEELHLEPVQTSKVVRGAVVVFIATLIGHLIPLAPFFLLALHPALTVAIVVSGVVLFGVGAYQAKSMVGDWKASGLKMLIIGLGAAALGFLVGRLFHTAGA